MALYFGKVPVTLAEAVVNPYVTVAFASTV